MPFWTYSGVGMDFYRAGTGQGLQAGDGGTQLHAVVCRQGCPALQDLLVLAKAQNRAPAAGTGVARAGAIRDHDHGDISGHGIPSVLISGC